MHATAMIRRNEISNSATLSRLCTVINVLAFTKRKHSWVIADSVHNVTYSFDHQAQSVHPIGDFISLTNDVP